jgi:protein transport protein SEC24
MENVTDMRIGALDCDKSLQMELKYNANLNEQSHVYIQVATLYTSCSGQRRIRINNLTLAVTSEYEELYQMLDQEAIFSFLLKQAESTVRGKSQKEMRAELVKRCTHILATFREECSVYAPPSQLVLPDAIQVLPLMVNCIVRSEALSGGPEVSVDDRAWLMHLIPSMGVDEVLRFLYPNVYPLTSLLGQIRASVEFMQQTEAYIVENGLLCFIWIGSEVPEEWIRDVFDERMGNVSFAIRSS